MRIKKGYIGGFGDYIFSEVSKRVEEVRRENPRRKIIDIGVGDVKIPLSSSCSKSMSRAARDLANEATFSGYPPDYGYEPLRKAICARYAELGCEISADEVFITCGAKTALADLASLIEGKAFVHLPNYPLYEELCSAFGIECIGEKVAPDGCRAEVIENDCDVCFICSPCNPTGEKISKTEIKELARVISSKQGAIIIDAAYAFMDDGYEPPFFDADTDKTVVEVNTFSKSASFTGVRCGYIIMKKENPLYSAYVKALSLRYNGVNITAQKAALSVFGAEGKREIARRRAIYRANAEIMAAPFVARGFNFSGGVLAPYLFVDVREDGRAFFEKLLKEKLVCVTPGEGFGEKGSIRLSCLCTLAAASEGAKRIAEFLDKRRLCDT